jgi:hypothetical protein
MKKFRNSLKVYAERYNRSTRTITAWIREGVDLDDDGAVRTWIAIKTGRRGGKRANLAELKLPKLSAEVIANVKTGAAEALRALESQEGRLRAELEAAQKTGDQQAITICLERWLKLNNQLRAFDLAIESNRRDSGELVPRGQAEEAIHNTGVWLNQAIINFAQKLAPVLSDEPNDPREPNEEPNHYGRVVKIIVGYIHESVKTALGWSDESVTPIPGWAKKAITSGLQLN